MVKVIRREDDTFPDKLRREDLKIKQIYVEGNEKILNDFGIAVIGSRNSSKEGEKITQEFVEQLCDKKINIISGLAKGIDSKAHKTCIINKGKTIAVIGSGHNYIYPKENKKLFEEIIKQGGAIISEYPPETEPKSSNFPQRNRIISGLSDGIIVIEGKYRSGTTITADYGIKQKKPVFCLPHGINNSYGTGPNKIIKNGGILVTEPHDIITYYENKNIKFKKVERKMPYDNEIIRLLLIEKNLEKEEIAIKLNKSISEINQELTLLELEGIITEDIEKGYKIIE